MTIPLTGTGGLFTRIGKIWAAIKYANSGCDAGLTTKVNNIFAQFNSTDMNLTGNLYSSLSSAQSTIPMASTLSSLASSVVTQMVAEDNPQPDSSLATAMKEVIRQMVATSRTIKASTVGYTMTSLASNSGQLAWVVTTLTPTGVACENLLPETIKIQCTQDGQLSPSVRFSETLSAKGLPSSTSALSPLWPGGSGASTLLTVMNPALSGVGGTGNWLLNSDLETQTGDSALHTDAATNWTKYTANSGVTTFWLTSNGSSPTSAAYNSGYVQLYAPGSVDYAGMYQAIIPDTVNAYPISTPVPNDILVAMFYMKRDTTSTTGTVTACLALRLSGLPAVPVPITDSAGNSNSQSWSVASLDTNYTLYTVAFRMPTILPGSAWFTIYVNGNSGGPANIYLDRLAIARPYSLYTQGPRVLPISLGTPIYAGDTWTMTTTNDRAGQFQEAFERLFGMRSMGLILPSKSDGTETIPNSLIA